MRVLGFDVTCWRRDAMFEVLDVRIVQRISSGWKVHSVQGKASPAMQCIYGVLYVHYE